jgi:hypothetical protein
MKPNKGWVLISRLYDNVNAALWAISLTALIYFSIFVIPMLPSIRDEYQRLRAQEIADENAVYCKKLNLKVGAAAYNECLLILGDFRVKVEQRISNEGEL